MIADLPLMNKPRILIIHGKTEKNNASNYSFERFLNERFDIDSCVISEPYPYPYPYVFKIFSPVRVLLAHRRWLKKYSAIVVMNLTYAMLLALIRKLTGNMIMPARLVVLDVGSTKMYYDMNIFVRCGIRWLAGSFSSVLCLSQSSVNFWREITNQKVKSILIYLPTGDGYFDVTTSHGDYLFSAGRYGRDFQTLFSAINNTDEKLIVVGGVSQYKSIASEITANPNVTYLEEIEHHEFVKLMAGARIVVIPLMATAYHTGQTVLVQAMAMGKTVIVSRAPGTSNYAEDGVDVFFYEPGNVSQLHNLILRLKNNPAEANRVAKNARKRAERDFRESTFAAVILRTLEQVKGS